jgi:F420-non-reducing hydrogenase large subunit
MQVWARLIELIYACERAEQIVRMPELSGQTRIPIKFHQGRGIGHVEAPRGTLIHDYEVDDDGIVRKANLIVATQQNYTSINDSIKQAAEGFTTQSSDDAVLGGIEFAIRCYDPCLSCATHALGQMPLEVVFRQGGEVLRTVRR